MEPGRPLSRPPQEANPPGVARPPARPGLVRHDAARGGPDRREASPDRGGERHQEPLVRHVVRERGGEDLDEWTGPDDAAAPPARPAWMGWLPPHLPSPARTRIRGRPVSFRERRRRRLSRSLLGSWRERSRRGPSMSRISTAPPVGRAGGIAGVDRFLPPATLGRPRHPPPAEVLGRKRKNSVCLEAARAATPGSTQTANAAVEHDTTMSCVASQPPNVDGVLSRRGDSSCSLRPPPALQKAKPTPEE